MGIFSKALSQLSALFMLKANRPDSSAIREAIASLDPPEAHSAYIREKLSGVYEPAPEPIERLAEIEAERQALLRRQPHIQAFHNTPPPEEYTLH